MTDEVTQEEADALSASFTGGIDDILSMAFKTSVWGAPGTHLTYVSFMGKRVLWHSWAVKPLMDVQKDLLAEGWDKKYAWTDLQTYNKRQIIGSSSWSMHSGPLAMDINPAQNPFNTHKTNIPARVREIFKKHGFAWGGDWSRSDPMHMEYQGPPVKNYTPSPHPTDSFPYGKRTLRVEKPLLSGNDVLWVQQQINKLKTYPQNVTQHLNEDGIFGAETSNCVEVFQYRYKNKYQLAQDGIVGPKTWLAFRKETGN